ncbi:SMARCC, C-terminal [Dillenia turbinata]|uniref:SMARCC, C-terminal n=1 Tax=Dillenia turbinata TaxID=194707 RepID=A0AAN8Z8P7_9MAGN
MVSTEDTGLRPPEDPELDLYTIPSYASWFSWNEIHETERISLKEFFDGSSISRTPKIYKEYRDFIISKYREDPSRRLTFTEIRKCLVGDVCVLMKVFRFLERWGLINFSATSSSFDDAIALVGEGEEKWNIKVEEGPPSGIRVSALPNSLKPVSLPPSLNDIHDTPDSLSQLPPLASYSDVFGDLKEQQHKGLACENCGENIDAAHYESAEGNKTICVKCYEDKNFEEGKSADDFNFKESIESCGKHGAVWTEAETLLLLESVLKHGDDWELVSQGVKTKTKFDCISRLLQLPFGELMLNLANDKGKLFEAHDAAGTAQQTQSSPPNTTNVPEMIDQCHENKFEQNGTASEGPPMKKRFIASLSDAGSSIMKQVALFSTMVGPRPAVAAAEAAVAALCEENPCTKVIFDAEEDPENYESSMINNEPERAPQGEKPEMDGRSGVSESPEKSSVKSSIPLTLRLRAAIATALGAAAARAKLLADQEDREMKKLHCKGKYLEDLEQIMENEYKHIQDLKESIITERIKVLQRAFNTGIPRLKEIIPL